MFIVRLICLLGCCGLAMALSCYVCNSAKETCTADEPAENTASECDSSAKGCVTYVVAISMARRLFQIKRQCLDFDPTCKCDTTDNSEYLSEQRYRCMTCQGDLCNGRFSRASFSRQIYGKAIIWLSIMPVLLS